MSARWMMLLYGTRRKAHLVRTDRAGPRQCEFACLFWPQPLSLLIDASEDAPRCKRCLAVERKSKERGR